MLKAIPFILLLASTYVSAQTIAKGRCTVAIQGNRNAPTLNCGDISPEEAQKFVDVLNAIQASNVSLDMLLSRLNEMLEAIKSKVDPNVVTVVYDFRGEKTTSSPHLSNIDSALMVNSFGPMARMYNNHKWQELYDFASKAVSATPEWYTPLFFQGIAETYLCKAEDAQVHLNQFINQVKDYPAYQAAMSTANSTFSGLRKGHLPPNCRR